MLDPIDWSRLFGSDTPLLEVFLRGTIVYLALFVMLRLVMKRQTGGIGVTDVLVIVIIADASQNAIADDYHTIPDGLLLVATIMFWDHCINWLSFHFPRFHALLDPKPVQLVKHGRILQRNLRAELITPEELDSQLRLQGVDDVTRVKCAYMESDGKISVITYGPDRTEAMQRRAKKGPTA